VGVAVGISVVSLLEPEPYPDIDQTTVMAGVSDRMRASIEMSLSVLELAHGIALAAVCLATGSALLLLKERHDRGSGQHSVHIDALD
jgi:hypothetical protein